MNKLTWKTLEKNMHNFLENSQFSESDYQGKRINIYFLGILCNLKFKLNFLNYILAIKSI